ncbi:helix-turn-helix domain-containing protein [Rubrolithibacter danxiaensis]|uniref:helix-turn-helix domain-containing protein n=1 Tax=Rubrolithibacter danxiaensis TaxID=3390805 RepID=UPI003BF8CE67
MSQIILNGLTTVQLRELFCEALKEHLQFPSKKQKLGLETPVEVDNTNLLTRVETAQILQISLPTLNTYTKRGLIKSYRIGSKIRYKFAEIEEALVSRNFGQMKKGGRCA